MPHRVMFMYKEGNFIAEKQKTIFLVPSRGKSRNMPMLQKAIGSVETDGCLI